MYVWQELPPQPCKGGIAHRSHGSLSQTPVRTPTPCAWLCCWGEAGRQHSYTRELVQEVPLRLRLYESKVNSCLIIAIEFDTCVV